MPRRRRPNGQGTTYQKANGKWVAQAYLDHSTGRKRESWVADTEEDALRLMREGRVRAKQGVPVKTSMRPLREWIQEWLTEIMAGTVRARSLNTYRIRLQHVVDALGNRPIQSVGPGDVRRLYRDLEARNYSAVTIGAIHRVFASCMKRAMVDGMIVTNPCTGQRLTQEEPPQRQVLSVDEISALLDAEDDPMWRGLWALLCTTGIRLGEATALTWPNVDLTLGEIAILSTLVRLPGGGWSIGPPKTKTSRRLIYPNPTTVAALAAWKREQDTKKLGSAQRFVFLGTRAQPLSQSSVNNRLRATLFRADLPVCRIHDLRHSAATNLLARGEQPNLVAEMLGHKSIAITLDLYGHVSPGMHREAQQRLDDALTAPKIGRLHPKLATTHR